MNWGHRHSLGKVLHEILGLEFLRGKVHELGRAEGEGLAMLRIHFLNTLEVILENVEALVFLDGVRVRFPVLDLEILPTGN